MSAGIAESIVGEIPKAEMPWPPEGTSAETLEGLPEESLRILLMNC